MYADEIVYNKPAAPHRHMQSMMFSLAYVAYAYCENK